MTDLIIIILLLLLLLKEEHVNHVICGAEFDRIVKETRENCEAIKARNGT